MLESDIYYRDYAYLKKLGDSYKLVLCNQVKRKGLEKIDVNRDDSVFFIGGDFLHKGRKVIHSEFHADYSCDSHFNGKVRDTTEDFKLANNISRARNKILEYVLCNDFNLFVTITLDPKKYDRTNLKKFNRDLTVFIRDYNKRKNANIFYLFIPETHLDGSWHLHGFIGGLDFDRLSLYELHGEAPLPAALVKKLKGGDIVFHFDKFDQKFGYNVLEPIKSKKQSALYMSKYLTKDISRNVTTLGNHLYYCSRSLKKAEIIKEGQFLDTDFHFDFSNEYGGQSFFDQLDPDQVEELANKIGGKPICLDDYKRGYRITADGFYEFADPDTGEIITRDPDVLEFIS